MGPLPRPTALLLDFGGVVVTGTPRPGWAAELAAEVHRSLTAAGCGGPDAGHIEADLRAGAAADAHWRNAMSRPAAPEEMSHHRFWTEFVAADWPAAARAHVAAHAGPLCRRVAELRQHRVARPGTDRLLGAAERAGVPVAIVSNALSGPVHRDFLAAHGFAERIAAQVYSDEAGVRKPNPEMIRLAARALGVEPPGCWYVGDNYDRDVLCGRRAGVGATILMEAPGTYDRPYPVRAEPDAVVAGPDGLRALLAEATTGTEGSAC
ncbi:HAD-IA family hydrolase [Streptomyces sp. SL13]|uniref:HAD-IA family hydrolase n=1 Tax=Streptantibioticus silvisoli TaxID=2705255 RepID=A0AA90KAB3_9ACTN|nr:HAD-IA family hydrolase [Streptantibioticus silvisoli]MDI5964719.1 HAD-IA family hydrolase [Streptantibioticus silvisoli]MDI5972193.1 HAD-IA family hydrolase [Streptantibioticus silvisoli]